MTAVYVIAAEGGPVKVGMAGDPRRRLTTLRTASAIPLTMVYSATTSGDARAVEQRAHHLLGAERMKGEWFSVGRDDAVAALKQAASDLGFALEATSDHDGRRAAFMKASQCRAARALVNLSAQQLATAASVGVNTVTRFEGGSGPQTRSVDKMQAALEAAGVIFIPENGDGPGVKLRKGMS